MISKETAERIAGVCVEIEEGEKALTALKNAEDKVSSRSPYLCIALGEDENSEMSTIDISRNFAKEIVEKQLDDLRGQYKRLNDIAAGELKE